MALSKAAGPSEVRSRIQLLVNLSPETAAHVMIVRLEHALPSGGMVQEIVLGGGQPHVTGCAGPVKRLASPYRGVSFHSCTQRWRGRIKHGSKSEHLGYYISDLEAAKAYNVAARKIHGESAQINEGVEEVTTDASGLRSAVVDQKTVEYTGETYYCDPPQHTRARLGSALLLQAQQHASVRPHAYQRPYPGFTDATLVHPVGKAGPDAEQPSHAPVKWEPSLARAGFGLEPCLADESWEDMFLEIMFNGEMAADRWEEWRPCSQIKRPAPAISSGAPGKRARTAVPAM